MNRTYGKETGEYDIDAREGFAPCLILLNTFISLVFDTDIGFSSLIKPSKSIIMSN
jgi:hypothetical protein